MRVLLISDLAHTGFGRVGRELGTGLLARGHDLRVVGINWRGVAGEVAAMVRRGEGPASERLLNAAKELAADPLLEHIIPADHAGDGMGHNLTAPAINGQLWPGWKPEAVLIVADARAMYNRLLTDNGSIGHAVRHGIPVLNYVPVEGLGLPASFRVIWDLVTPVAMTAFGQEQLQSLLGRPVDLAYHGVSPTFRPLSPSDHGRIEGRAVTSKDGAKEALGMAGRTVVLRIDRHIARKNYAAFFRVMRPVLAKHPEVITVIHARPTDEYGDLRELISREPGAVSVGNVWSHPQYHLTLAHDSWRGLDDESLRALYCAADLLVSPTMAEGFGLTHAEALACGVPVVTTNYSAMPEVVGPGGLLIEPSGFFTNEYAHEWALVDEPAMSAAVERLITKPGKRAELGTLGRRHVARFTWDAAVEVFDRLITQPAAVAA